MDQSRRGFGRGSGFSCVSRLASYELGEEGVQNVEVAMEGPPNIIASEEIIAYKEYQEW